MWCQRCAQFVAGVINPAGDGVACAQCLEPLDVLAPPPANGALGDAPPRAASLRRHVEHELPYLACGRQRLDHIGRRLDALARRPKSLEEPAHLTADPSATTQSGADLRRRRWSLMRTLAWCGLCAGLGALACGVALAGWSLVTDRQALWNLGLPIALTGQFLLLAALATQVDGLRMLTAEKSASTRDRRRASALTPRSIPQGGLP